jgi:hypothetical protein
MGDPFNNPMVRLNPFRAQHHLTDALMRSGELKPDADGHYRMVAPRDPRLKNYRAPAIDDRLLRTAREMWAEGNVEGFLALTDSPDRQMLFMCNFQSLKQAGLLERALTYTYSTMNLGMAVSITDLARWFKSECNRERLRAAGDPMPDGDDPLTLYRGVGRWSGRRRGMSWTGTLSVATWFACRGGYEDREETERQVAKGGPLVLKTSIKRKDVLFYTLDEDEYVLVPPGHKFIFEVPMRDVDEIGAHLQAYGARHKQMAEAAR